MLAAGKLVCCRHFLSLISLQCMFYPSSEDFKVDFVHVCRSKHEEATMIIVDDWLAFDFLVQHVVFINITFLQHPREHQTFTTERPHFRCRWWRVMERTNRAFVRGRKRGRRAAAHRHSSECNSHPNDEHQHFRQQLCNRADQLLQYCW